MGKAISRSIKNKARTLIKHYKKDLSTDFDKNKQFIKTLEVPLSPLTINLIAGYITREIKKEATQAA